MADTILPQARTRLCTPTLSPTLRTTTRTIPMVRRRSQSRRSSWRCRPLPRAWCTHTPSRHRPQATPLRQGCPPHSRPRSRSASRSRWPARTARARASAATSRGHANGASSTASRRPASTGSERSGRRASSVDPTNARTVLVAGKEAQTNPKVRRRQASSLPRFLPLRLGTLCQRRGILFLTFILRWATFPLLLMANNTRKARMGLRLLCPIRSIHPTLSTPMPTAIPEPRRCPTRLSCLRRWPLLQMVRPSLTPPQRRHLPTALLLRRIPAGVRSAARRRAETRADVPPRRPKTRLRATCRNNFRFQMATLSLRRSTRRPGLSKLPLCRTPSSPPPVPAPLLLSAARSPGRSWPQCSGGYSRLLSPTVEVLPLVFSCSHVLARLPALVVLDTLFLPPVPLSFVVPSDSLFMLPAFCSPSPSPRLSASA